MEKKETSVIGEWILRDVEYDFEVPNYAEKISIGEFLVSEKIKSKWAPGYDAYINEAMKCPCCGYCGKHPFIGSRFDCPECELEMYVEKRTINIWRTGTLSPKATALSEIARLNHKSK